MRALLAAVALAAAVLGLAGLGTLILEDRLSTLAPGGVEIAALHYNPFTGNLLLAGVRAHDAAGREVFQAARVAASASPFRLLARPLVLSRVRLVAPRLTLRTLAGFELADLAAGLPLRVDDLAVTGGTVSVEGAGEDGAPALVRDLNVRLSRLTTAALGAEEGVAFAVEMAVYGTLVHVTGQPRRERGYLVHVRARGLDTPALLRDFPIGALTGLERGQGDVDADLLLTGGQLLASGSARVTDAVMALPVAGRPRLRAATLAVMLDRFDLTTGTGRIARLDLAAPSLSVQAAAAGPALAALLEPLRDRPDLVVRRLAVSDGSLTLEGTGLRFQRLQLAAEAAERRGEEGWVVNAQAALGPQSDVTLAGVLARDLRVLDAVTRLQQVTLAPWRALAGATSDWDARVSFDGRVRLTTGEGAPVATLAGRAVLADVRSNAGLWAERVALGRLAVVGQPFSALFAVLEDATRVEAAAPATLPAAALQP